MHRGPSRNSRRCVLKATALLGLLLAGRFAPAAEDEEALRLVREHEAQRAEVLTKAARAIVCIFSDRAASGGGAGVIIDENGLGLTNYHVISGMVGTRQGYGGLSDGQLYPLTVWGVDPGGDIAVFKLDGKARFDFAPLGDSDALRAGQWVAAMGNPFVLAEDYTPTITLGVISGLHRYQYGQGEARSLLEYADCIQVSTSINPGNSGGPLIDMAGRVLGINGRASFEERGRVNVGLGYAVSVNQIKRFLPALRAGRLCEHGTLGAAVRTGTDGLVFDQVQELSPAARAGVRAGDELLSVCGKPVRTSNDFNNALAILPSEWPVVLTVRRTGQALTVATRLERLPVRLPRAVIPELSQNEAEVLHIWQQYEQGDRLGQGRRIERVTWRCRVTWRGETDAGSAVLLLTQDAAGRLRVEPLEPAGATPQEFEVGDTPPARPQAAQPGALENDRLWYEWFHLSRPLLMPPQSAAGWEALGADEFQDELVVVLRRSLAGGARVRWKYAPASGRLRVATVTYGAETCDPFLVSLPSGAVLNTECDRITGAPESAGPAAALWLVEGRIGLLGLQWPQRWRRLATNGDETVVEMLGVDEPATWSTGPTEGDG